MLIVVVKYMNMNQSVDQMGSRTSTLVWLAALTVAILPRGSEITQSALVSKADK